MKRLPSGIPLLLALLLVPTITASCRETPEGCAQDPVGEITIFLEGPGEPASDEFSASVEDILPPDDLGFRRYRLRDEADGERTLVFQAPQDSLPLIRGRSYGIRIETVPGTPTPCAVVVEDGDGLVFAGVSDYAPGERVLTTGLPGWDIRRVESDCPDRNRESCLASERNVVLQFRHGEEEHSLMHGERVRMGGMIVRCLDARVFSYSGECPDFAEFGTVYTIRREP